MGYKGVGMPTWGRWGRGAADRPAGLPSSPEPRAPPPSSALLGTDRQKAVRCRAGDRQSQGPEWVARQPTNKHSTQSTLQSPKR